MISEPLIETPDRSSNPVRRKLLDITGGDPYLPLTLLFLLWFFDQFDTAAFNVLAPDIKRSFHLTDRAYLGIVVINVSIVLMAAIPVGHYGDRLKRVLMVVVGGILAGTFSLLTGLVTTVGLFVLVRLGNGFGQLVNDPIHTSLLTDYYKVETRPRVFSFHRNAVQVGAIIGAAVAGGIAFLAGWRVAFMVLMLPILATVAVAASRLREPRRGQTDDPDNALEAERENPTPFREAYRTLLAVKTLRREYVGWAIIGAGLIPLGVYLPLYLDRVYHLNAAIRGVIIAANSGFTFLGVLKSGKWTQGWLAKSMGEPIRRSGMALAGTGVGLLLISLTPWLALALLLGFATSFVIGIFTPAFVTTQALVSPARVRSLSFSLGALFVVAGAAVFFVTPLATISDTYGIRWGIGATTPFWVIAGLVVSSAAQYVTEDTNRAFRTLATTAELRRQRLTAGERSLLLCSGVDVAYDSVQVLFGVDLEVKEGEIVALLGTNGAGKSTLLKAISGLVDPIGGAIFFDGVDVTHADAQKAAKAGIVQMPGGRSIFPTLTVNECLRLAAWMYKRQDPAHVKAATAQVLDYFPILRERGDQLAGNLSGGEQQMLGLGMAFIAKPRILLIDELSLGLAPTIVARLVEIVRAIHAGGTTIVIVEQSVNVALTLAERAVFMEKGEVRFSGPTSELLERDDVLRSVFLEGAASASKTDGASSTRSLVRPRDAVREDAPVVLALIEVTKRFGGIRAVDEASFQLRKGEILGLIGPNGAGKTTIFDLVSGFVIPDSGRITLEGRDITEWSPDKRSWAGLGRSFQDARLFASLTVAENIAVALERHLAFRDPLASALGLPAVAEEENDVAWSVHELIELLGLGAFRNKFVSELSTGSRRIVDLAMAIAHQPSVLILDEPSSGIAQRETEALGPLLLRIQREVDCSLLVIEHDMPLVTGIADRLVALELGHVVTIGTPTEVVNHPQVVASYLGTDAEIVARSGARAVAEGMVADDAEPADFGSLEELSAAAIEEAELALVAASSGVGSAQPAVPPRARKATNGTPRANGNGTARSNGTRAARSNGTSEAGGNGSAKAGGKSPARSNGNGNGNGKGNGTSRAKRTPAKPPGGSTAGTGRSTTAGTGRSTTAGTGRSTTAGTGRSTTARTPRAPQ